MALSLQNVLALEFSYGPAAVKYLWGELHFRLLMQPGPAYRWQFQIPPGGLSVPSWITKGIPVGSIKMVGGKLKLPAAEVKFWGGFGTTEWGCEWDLGVYDPRIMWPERRIALSMSAWDVKMWVWDGFGGRQTPGRRVARRSARGIPVYQDSSHLEFLTKTDEVLPEMGWFRGNNNGLLHSGGYGMSA